ncbi:hypothetical protein [Paenibacillus tuaregi]|uniref:hypothetical protein n=1 Tax=Paenibacillus tuaregi TaxID=1816681 RepID=UPI000837E39C|nr:hypothetical protein [Paenibacillus tuaregi]
MLAILFAGIAIYEWIRVKSPSSRDKRVFWWVLSILLVWNTAGNFLPWWPNPNRILLFVTGWF